MTDATPPTSPPPAEAAPFRRVAVLGAGLMGTGIAQCCAEAGFPVTWIDVSADALDRGRNRIDGFMQRKAAKGRLTTEEAADVTRRLTPATDLAAAADTDLVIEAVPEKLPLKQQVFRELDAAIGADTVVASNTSGLSVSALGACSTRPERVAGMHFFYPAPLMKLVELTPGMLTDPSVIDRLRGFADAIGKTPVLAKDYPGFVVNRMLVPMLNEAIHVVMEGVSPDDVDAAMTLGANHPMGPITLADFVGLDILLATMEGLHDGFRDSKYRPCPLLVRMVEAGTLGRKTGRGFYRYDPDGRRTDGPAAGKDAT